MKNLHDPTDRVNPYMGRHWKWAIVNAITILGLFVFILGLALGRTWFFAGTLLCVVTGFAGVYMVGEARHRYHQERRATRWSRPKTNT